MSLGTWRCLWDVGIDNVLIARLVDEVDRVWEIGDASGIDSVVSGGLGEVGGSIGVVVRGSVLGMFVLHWGKNNGLFSIVLKVAEGSSGDGSLGIGGSPCRDSVFEEFLMVLKFGYIFEL